MVVYYFVIAFVAGIAGIVYGYTEQARVSEFDKDGVSVIGEIMQGEERSGRRGRRSYTFEITYQVEGRSYTNQFSVTGDYFKQHVRGDEIGPNSAVELKYLPRDPNQAIVVGGSTDGVWALWAGLAGAGIGLFGIVGLTVWKNLNPKPAA
jgi:hypothetical protein